MRKVLSALFGLCTAMALSGCAVEKTSNPLSPTVAGPIAGVNVSSPTPMQPASGAQIAADQQPVTLVVQNSTSNGVRPLSYIFEVAADAGFTSLLFSKSGVTPGDNGRTSVKLSDPLATSRTYYWRSKADDGANSSGYSSPASFSIFTPVLIGAPGLASPVGGIKLDTLRPTFVISDALTSGPVGSVGYVIELADSDTFVHKIAVWTVNQQPTQTSFVSPQDLAASTTYFWRAQGFDPSTTGAYSGTASFRTPDAVVAPPTGGGGGSGGGGVGCGAPAGVDGLNMGAAGIYDSPADLGTWCIGAKITSITFQNDSFLVDFSRRTGGNRWPDYSPPGWSGSLQYTLGMCLNVNGSWACSAVVEFWYGRELTASAPPSQISTAWFYDSRWGPLAGRQPADGEQVGIFVCAGDCRNVAQAWPGSLKERSNVQMVTWSNSGGPSYSY
jgi:hypothetical protein